MISGFNNSPQFKLKDTTLVCAKKKFTLDFSAQDADGDSLSYSFCDAYSGVRNDAGALSQPYTTLLPYISPYSGTNPLGFNVTINPKTGLISGTAPDEGRYVVNVCVSEFRNGKLINQHRKDFLLRVQSCDIIEAALPDKITNCNNYFVHFEDLSSSSAILSYQWTLVNANGSLNINSTDPTLDFTFPDTGRFTVSLTVNGPNGCVGNTSAPVLIYPGFFPNFGIAGDCFMKPFTFTDSTTAKYGFIDSWSWNFGDSLSGADTSHLKNPVYSYSQPQSATTTLIVTSSKGCIDTLSKPTAVLGRPIINLPFHDTLICSIDTLPLFAAVSGGTYSWTPHYNIIDTTSATPLVYPKDTTTYIVTVTQNGCINTDSVKVNVLDFISVKLEPDTGICKTDVIQLRPVSYALGYRWSPAATLNDPTVKYPLAQPLVNTRYYVLANLGKCQASDSVLVHVTPYPQANAGKDTLICFGDRAQLHASITGSSFKWTPTSSLLDVTVLNPVAGPSTTTAYVLSVHDTLGCPKPMNDTVIVVVQPPIHVFAGRDTSVVENQPLQLNVTTSDDGATMFYTWTPSLGLSSTTISNPVATLTSGIDSIKYTVRASIAEGCYGTDDIVVRVYNMRPDIFVPSAFTPNGDGKNDVVRAITTGIQKFEYLRIYNRWGQMVYSTSDPSVGWDGSFGGTPQSSGTYVYITQGIDYNGKVVFRKGTVVLIR